MIIFRVYILMMFGLIFSLSISGQIKPKNKQTAPTKKTETVTKPNEYPISVPTKQLNFINEYCGYEIATDQKWNEIVKDLDLHRLLAHDQKGLNLFFTQMYEIANISRESRQTQGGWAGNFILDNFQYALFDIHKNPEKWGLKKGSLEDESGIELIPFDTNQEGVQDNYFKCMNGLRTIKLIAPAGGAVAGQAVAGIIAHLEYSDVCLSYSIGELHKQRQLEPTFACYIGGLTRYDIENYPTEIRFKKIMEDLTNLRKEHELFIERAIIPAFNKNPYANVIDRLIATDSTFGVPFQVRELRQTWVEKYLRGYAAQNLIPPTEVEKIIKKQAECHCVY
jgi:hypothetical protein